MYTCGVCGARYRPGTACEDCERAAKLLKLTEADATFLIDWVKEVARIQVEEHEGRYYHNRRPDY